MESQNPYEVTETDFKELENIFKKVLTEITTSNNIEPLLLEQLEYFVVELGVSVKDLLQKYYKDNQIKTLEVEQAQEDVMKYKHRDVKRTLKMKQVENAIQAFKNVS
jgi:hypothetical protein